MISTIRHAVLSSLVILVILVFALSHSAGEQPATGTITGLITYTGKVPPPEKIMTTEGGIILHHDLVVERNSKGLRYVVAVLEDAKPQPKLKKAKPALIDQRDMIFIPRVIAVQDGQPVWFDNSDLSNHSVMAISPVEKNSFNVFTPPNQPHKVTFELQERPIIIGCSLHSWMRAWVYTIPHPWFAVTDEKGTFKIENIPPGKYTLRLEHPDTRTQMKRQIEVQPGKTATVAVDWKEAKRP